MIKIRKLQLIISAAVEIFIAFVDGSANGKAFSAFFDFKPHLVDTHNIFSAIYHSFIIS